MSTDTLERPGTIDVVDTTVTPQLSEPGDHERLSHVVKKSDWDRAYLGGEAVTAACGKTWLPSRDPDAFPVCPACKEFLGNTQPGDEGESGPEHRDLT